MEMETPGTNTLVLPAQEVVATNREAATPEKQLLRNSENIHVTRIVFEIGRHDDKAPAKEGQTDNEVTLTDMGAEHAMGVASNAGFRQGDKAFGSPAMRAGQTAVLHAFGLSAAGERTSEVAPPIISRHPTYGELQQFMGPDFQVRQELGFRIGTGDYKKEFMAAAVEKRLVDYIYHESDQRRAAFGETDVDSYSTFAGNVATLVKEGLNDAAENDDQKGKSPTADVELDEKWRYCGSHAGVAESFLLKVIGKNALAQGKTEQEAVEAQEEFIKALGGNAFGFSESIRAEVFDFGGLQEPQVRVRYLNKNAGYSFDEMVSPKVIDEIIAEGQPQAPSAAI